MLKQLVFCLSFASICFAMTLSLQECIKIGLKNNKELHIAQAQIKQAEGNLVSARSGFLPNIQVTGGYTYIGIIPKTEFRLFETEGPVQIPVFRFPATPTEYYVPFYFPSPEYELARRHNWQAEVKITQPIFTWFRIWNNYRVAEINLEIARRNYNLKKSKILFDIKKAFYSVLVAQNFVELAKQSVNQLDEHLKVVEANYKQGIVSRYDLLTAKVQLENTKPKLTKAKNKVQIALLGLKTILGLKLEEPLEIKGTLETELEIPPDLQPDINIALKNREDIKIIDLSMELSEVSKSLIAAGNKPNLVSMFNYTYTHRGPDRRPFEPDNPHSWNVALALTFPISEWFPISKTAGDMIKAEAMEEELKIKKEQLVKSINFELTEIQLTLNEVAERLRGLKETVVVAEENYKIAKARYKEGLLTNIEVIRAEVSLMEAKTNYVQSLYDYIIAKIRLEKVLGLTGRNF